MYGWSMINKRRRPMGRHAIAAGGNAAQLCAVLLDLLPAAPSQIRACPPSRARRRDCFASTPSRAARAYAVLWATSSIRAFRNRGTEDPLWSWPNRQRGARVGVRRSIIHVAPVDAVFKPSNNQRSDRTRSRLIPLCRFSRWKPPKDFSGFPTRLEGGWR